MSSANFKPKGTAVASRGFLATLTRAVNDPTPLLSFIIIIIIIIIAFKTSTEYRRRVNFAK